MELEHYRTQAQDFLTAYVAERNDFHAGLKDEFKLESIFLTYEALFRKESISKLFSAYEGALPGKKRRDQYLLGFAVGHALNRHVHKQDQEISALLKSSTETVGDEEVAYYDAAVQLAKENDRARRKELLEARGRIQEKTQALRLDRIQAIHAKAQELSGMPYLECLQFTQGANFLVLRSQLEAFLAASRQKYMADLELFAARHLGGIRREEMGPEDASYLLRGKDWDEEFPADRLLSVLKRTLMGLGIDLKKQANIRIDAEERRGKNAEAACFGIRVPGKIYLVLRPHGGLRDYANLLQKTGHALHLGHTAEDQPFEYRYLGDGAVSQTYGALFQGLLHNAEWLKDQLQIEDSRELVAFLRFRKLYWLRRYAARFLYEMELHQTGVENPEALQERFLTLHLETLGFPGDPKEFLADVEDPFYGTSFLRAWIFEAELRQTIEERFGTRWYTRPAAGGFLKDLWSYGTRYRVEELAKHIRLMDLDLEPIKRDLTQ